MRKFRNFRGFLPYTITHNQSRGNYLSFYFSFFLSFLPSRENIFLLVYFLGPGSSLVIYLPIFPTINLPPVLCLPDIVVTPPLRPF